MEQTRESLIKTEKKADIFDKIMSWKILKPLEPFYKKNKEILLYLFFGALTTIISFITYYIPIKLLDIPNINFFKFEIDINLIICNVISWICAVTFSYITSRIWVFESSAQGRKNIVKECSVFFGGRVFTLVVETILIAVCVDIFPIDKTIMKIPATIVTLVLNYIISKLFVFKKIKEEA